MQAHKNIWENEISLIFYLSTVQHKEAAKHSWTLKLNQTLKKKKKKKKEGDNLLELEKTFFLPEIIPCKQTRTDYLNTLIWQKDNGVK